MGAQVVAFKGDYWIVAVGKECGSEMGYEETYHIEREVYENFKRLNFHYRVIYNICSLFL